MLGLVHVRAVNTFECVSVPSSWLIVVIWRGLTDVLETDEVLAIRSVGGDRSGDGVTAPKMNGKFRALLGKLGRLKEEGVNSPGAPRIRGEFGARVADLSMLLAPELLKTLQIHKITYSLLEDLEPVTRSIVGLDIIIRGAGHVDQAGACKGFC